MSFYPKYRITESRTEKLVWYAGALHIIEIPAGFKYRPSIPNFLIKLFDLDLEKLYQISLIHDWLFSTKATSYWTADGIALSQLAMEIGIERTLIAYPFFKTISFFYWIT